MRDIGTNEYDDMFNNKDTIYDIGNMILLRVSIGLLTVSDKLAIPRSTSTYVDLRTILILLYSNVSLILSQPT